MADPLATSGLAFYRDILVASWVVYLASLVGGLLISAIVPRVLFLLIEPEQVYSLYGVRYWAQRVITRLTNIRSHTWLFGDSSLVVGFLTSLGYRLGPIEQTGSNFGMDVKHDIPYLCSAGKGTVVADGLTFVNAEFSSSSFKVSPVSLGASSFLGNKITYPARAKVGDNCLLGTKVMVPIDGEIRQNVGLLGSPPFEIPRTVERDAEQAVSADVVAQRLRPKNRHNLVTIGLYMLSRGSYFFLLAAAGAYVAHLQKTAGPMVIAIYVTLPLLLSVFYWVPLDRMFTRYMAWVPDGVSIYERPFWRHERFWKIPAIAYLNLFNGTPFKGLIWRMLGVRIGGRVFDDGCSIVERTFVTIGYDCTLNATTVIQCHSQEDGAFKSDIITLGAGVTLGVGAFIHYGVTIGDGAVVEADSFLMKGEEIPPYSRWGGNPAEEIQGQPAIGAGVSPGLSAPRSAA
jgi:non-ribosomal peptide synthetase-like protein